MIETFGGPVDRETSLALLRNHHEFPGAFEFRAVVMPHATAAVVGAIVAAAGDGSRAEDISERRSRNGNYVAVRVRIHVANAERDEVFREVEGSHGALLARYGVPNRLAVQALAVDSLQERLLW